MMGTSIRDMDGGFCRARKPLYSPLSDANVEASRPAGGAGRADGGRKVDGRAPPGQAARPAVRRQRCRDRRTQSGYPAAEMFERYGERDFRDGERRLVARLIEGDIRVIATGGGAYVDPTTRKLLNERAITIWLDAPVDILAERTSRRDTRAQLRNGDPQGRARAALRGTAAVLRRSPYPREKRRRRAPGCGRSDRRGARELPGRTGRGLSRLWTAGRRGELARRRTTVPGRHEDRRSRFAVRAVRNRASDIRGRPGRFRRRLDAARLQRGPAHRPPRFRTARARQRRDRARRARSGARRSKARTITAACGKASSTARRASRG